MRTPDLAASNVEKIAEIFPHCVTEAHGANGELQRKIDWDLLRQELSSDLVEGVEERYRLDWPGKRQALYTGNMPINKTLRPCRGDSVDFDRSENLFIEGDNLDVLKLLQHTYMGKVKVIYIDPPYNTGKDFIYRDNYATSRDEYLRSSGQVDDAGNRLVANNESNGRFHSDWLSMMYPRLRLAQKLLRDDGFIFISIDDNEQASLRRLCDEVFGEHGFVEQFTLRSNPRGNQARKLTASEHDYVLCYTRDIRKTSPLSLKKSDEEYKKVDDRGKYREIGLRKRGAGSKRQDAPGQYFPIYYCVDTSEISLTEKENSVEIFPKFPDGSDGRWRWSSKTVELNRDDLLVRLVKRRGGYEYDIFEKDYYTDSSSSKLKSILSEKNVNFEKGTIELSSLFDSVKVFSYPKPVSLLIDFVRATLKQSDIILDFFSGSATTAHAVMQLNAEDGGNRKFIMVQLPEACDPKSEAYKAGYKTIADIGRERIRRAGAKILAGECHESWNKDVGFRSLLVDSSNMNNAYYSPAETKQGQLDLWAREYIKLERSGEDLLFQVLLDWGLGLTLPIERQQICGLEVFIVDDNQLVACFAQAGEIDDELFYHLAKRRPRRALFRSSGLTVDSTQTNAEQIFGLISPSTEIKIL